MEKTSLFTKGSFSCFVGNEIYCMMTESLYVSIFGVKHEKNMDFDYGYPFGGFNRFGNLV